MIRYLKMDLIAASVMVVSLFVVQRPFLTPASPVTQMVTAVPAQANVSATNGVPANAVQGSKKKWHPLRAMATGIASWYGPMFNGHRTASGEVFDQEKMTACHRTLPFGTMVRVVNVASGKSVVVKINDRGLDDVPNRIIDLSSAAAKNLGILSAGVAKVRLEILGKADKTPDAEPIEEARKQTAPSVATPL